MFAPSRQAFGVAWGDYDNDGDLDLFIACAYGQRSLMLENQNGQFVDVTAPPLTTIGHTASGVWGDMDQDGDLDLFIGNVKTDSIKRRTSCIGTNSPAGIIGSSWICTGP